jgi:hypothetical protein
MFLDDGVFSLRGFICCGGVGEDDTAIISKIKDLGKKFDHKLLTEVDLTTHGFSIGIPQLST